MISVVMIDHVYQAVKARWIGTIIVLWLVFTAYCTSPLVHVIAGWYGAWWCYLMLKQKYGGLGRLVVWFLCWSASFHAFVNQLNWATIYTITFRLGLDG